MRYLEIACFSLEACQIAVEAGAHRIEFCENYALGGITPKLADIERALLLQKRPPMHIMIRPRGGDFVYNEEEVLTMINQIEQCNALGADGFVLGCLTKDDEFNYLACKRLLDAAQNKPCVFHRAFDLVKDAEIALEKLIELGFSGVLTSGGLTDAVSGAQKLKTLQTLADGRIQIVAGGGVRSKNIKFLQDTGVNWFHSAAWNPKSNLPDFSEIVKIREELMLSI